MKLEPRHWKGDLFGGLTTGVVALPLALAFGVASGLEHGPKAGLYGAIILGFVAAIFGGTKPQVSGPTGPMTVVAAGFVATSDRSEYLFLAVFLGGLIQVVFGLLGFGHFIRYVPRPVVSGFMTGIGVIIFTLQLQPILGAASEPGPIEAITRLPTVLANVNLQALLLSLLVIALIYVLPRLSKSLPASLIALILGTLAAEWLKLDVARIGPLPTGLPQPALLLPDIAAVPHVLVTALALAILGSLDSLLGSVVVDQVTQTRHQSDKELVGQGMGNTLSGIFGGLPGAGATMRTLLNIRTGGRTGLAGVIHSLLLTAILLGLSSYAALIPLPVLAGILITVGVSIIDYPGLRLLPKLPRPDRAVLLLVLGLTVLVDLITAVQMGFLLATLLFLQSLSDRELTRGGTLSPMVEAEHPESQQLAEQVQVIQAEGPIFFGTSEAFVEAFEGDTSGLRAIILRVPRVPLIDQTGAFALQEFVLRMVRRKIVVVLSGLPDASRQVLCDLGVIPHVLPEESVVPSLHEAVEALNRLLVTRPEETLVPKSYLFKVGG